MRRIPVVRRIPVKYVIYRLTETRKPSPATPRKPKWLRIQAIAVSWSLLLNGAFLRLASTPDLGGCPTWRYSIPLWCR